MSLKVSTDMPYGNARAVTVCRDGDMPEVQFAPSPQFGPEAMWFCFKLTETRPEAEPPGKVRITLNHFDNILGAKSAADLVIVYRPAGQGWYRANSGVGALQPDGQTSVSWLIPYPAPSTELALCYPYGKPEVDAIISKSRGYWKEDVIGLSQGSRPLTRISNDYGAPGGSRHGLYLVARQHSGETPGSWVLDGLLQYFSKSKKDPLLIWCVPLANIDGIMLGDYGKDNFPYDLNRAWGTPPMRHETLVIQRDVQRWRGRCQPALAIDFHAPGACDTDGIFCFLPPAAQFPDQHRASERWANVLFDELGKDYAAEKFKRESGKGSRWNTPMFTEYMAENLGIAALSIETPYSKIGSTVLAQKHYRDAGERIARALMRKGG